MLWDTPPIGGPPRPFFETVSHSPYWSLAASALSPASQLHCTSLGVLRFSAQGQHSLPCGFLCPRGHFTGFAAGLSLREALDPAESLTPHLSLFEGLRQLPGWSKASFPALLWEKPVASSPSLCLSTVIES